MRRNNHLPMLYRIVAGFLLVVSTSSCAGEPNSAQTSDCVEVTGHEFDDTNNCYLADTTVEVGCFAANPDGLQNQALGCYVDDARSIVVLSPTTSPPYAALLENGYSTCGDALQPPTRPVACE